jgi:hypothetical protein
LRPEAFKRRRKRGNSNRNADKAHTSAAVSGGRVDERFRLTEIAEVDQPARHMSWWLDVGFSRKAARVAVLLASIAEC